MAIASLIRPAFSKSLKEVIGSSKYSLHLLKGALNSTPLGRIVLTSFGGFLGKGITFIFNPSINSCIIYNEMWKGEV